jgi:hypothetical protein
MARVLVLTFLIAVLYGLFGLNPSVVDKEILYYGTISAILLIAYFITDLFRNFKFSFQALFIILPVIIVNYLIPYDININVQGDFLNFLAIGVFAFFISSNSNFTNHKNIFLSTVFSFVLKLVLIALCLLLIGKQDNYYIQLFTDNLWFVVLILLSPAPFILIFSDAETRFIKAPIIKQFYNRTFFLIIFSLILLFILVMYQNEVVSANIIILIGNSLACALLIAVSLILYSLRNKSDLFFLLLISVLFAYVVSQTDYILDPFITFFFAGLFINYKTDLTKMLKNVEKNSIEIFQLYLLVYFLINVHISPSLIPYAFVLVVLNIVVIYVVSKLENHFFHNSNSKIEYLKYISISQGLVTFYFLHLLETYLSLDKELVTILEIGIIINSIIGLIYFEYGRIKFNDQFNDEQSDYHLDSVELNSDFDADFLPECKNLNKYLNDFKHYYRQNLEQTILDISKDNHENILKLAKEYFHEYKSVFDKFSKELGIIKYGNEELSKEKVRENRNLLTQKFYNFSQEAEEKLKSLNHLEEVSQNFVQGLEKKISSYPRIYELERFFDISIQETDHFGVRVYKKSKSVLNKILYVILPENKIQREIRLKEILTFHLYQRFVTATRVYQNQYYHHFFITVKHFHNIYKDMDQQFVSFFNYIDETYDDQLMFEKYNHVFDAFIKESEHDFNEAIVNIERSYEANISILEKGYRSMMQQSYKDFLKSGTIAYSKRKHRLSKVYNQYQYDLEFLKKNNQNWNRIIRSYLGHTCIDLDIKLLQNKVRKILNHSIQQFSNHIHTYIKALVQSLNSYYDNQFKDLFNYVESAKKIEAETLNEYKKKISYQSKINTEKSIENLRYSKKLNQYIHEIIGNIHESVNDLPQFYRVGLSKIHTIHYGEYPKDIIIEKIPLRDISRNYLEMEVTKVLSDLNNQISVGIDNLLQILNKNRVNLNEEFEQYTRDYEINKITKTELVSNIRSSEKEALKKIKEGMDFIDSVNESISTTIIREVVKKTQDLKEQTISRIDHIILEIYQKHRDESDETIRNEVYERFKIIKLSLISAYKKITQQFRNYRDEFSAQEEKLHVDYDYFNIEEKDFSNIPFMYRKLLSLEPLEIKDLMLNRGDEFSVIENSIKRWKKGFNSNILVIGSVGVGKTSFVNCVNKYMLSNENHFRYKLNKNLKSEEDLVYDLSQVLNIHEEIKTLEALRAKISSNKVHTIIIVESIHMLFNREFGGFDLFRLFHDFLNKCSDNILWINTISTGSYEYLSSLGYIDDYYYKNLIVKPFDKEGLIRLFRQRNKMSGFEIEYLTNGLTNKELKKLKVDQSKNYLENRYFESLFKISEGNIYNAIFHWLKSLSIENDSKIYVKQLAINYDHLFKTLDTKKLLLLQCLYVRGLVETEVLSEQLAITIEEVDKELNFLRNRNLITKVVQHKTVSYTINKIAFIPIKKFLKESLILI